MSKVQYVLRYYALYYPHSHELSKTRITKMVYLADWFSAKEYNSQITNIKWYFDHYGPYVSDVYDAAVKDSKLVIRQEVSVYGFPKEIIALRKQYNKEQLNLYLLSDRETKILDKVIEETRNLYWSDFINYVYDTYPIKTQKRYSYLNLVELARQERESG